MAKPRIARTYKVVVGYFDGYMGCGEMGFAGINALARAKLGIEVVKERLRRRGLTYEEMRIDLIGMNSLHANEPDACPEPQYEVREACGLPCADTLDKRAAEAVGAEVRSLHYARPQRRRWRREFWRPPDPRGEVGADPARMGEAGDRRGARIVSVRVYDLGHARAGDKGNTSNISVTAYSDEAWQVLWRELTPDVVLAHFGHITAGPVHRYELPQLRALNFVIENALGGGVTAIARDRSAWQEPEHADAHDYAAGA